jgi:hypothetical protein
MVPMPGGGSEPIVLGAPGVLSTWVFELLRDVCERMQNRVAPRFIDRGDLVEPHSGEKRPSQIYLSQFPSPSLLARCKEKTAPILLVLDDPVDSVRYLQHFGQSRLVEALRLQTAATASYAQLRGHPRVMILNRMADLPAKGLIDLILGHLELSLPSDQYDGLCRKRVGPPGQSADLESTLRYCVSGYEPLEEGVARFTAQELVMIGGVLGPLIQMSFLDNARPIVWPIQAFLSGDRPDTPASLVADLTGAARILYYGPYFNLPSGSWAARMMIGFSAGARPTTMDATHR